LSGLLNDPSLSLFGGNSSGSLNYAGGYQPDMAGMYSGTNQGGSGADPASQYWAWVMAHLNSPDFGGSPGGSGGGLGGGYLGNLGGGFGDFGGGYGDLGSLGTLGGSPQDTGSFNDFSGGGYDSNPATNNWWESSDPWGALTNTNWLTPPGSSGNMAGMEGSDFTNPGNLLGFDPNATEPDPYPYGDIFG
jgi:hypothetical protein